MRRPCSIEGCDRPLLARGLCGLHYERQRIASKPSCAIDGCEKRAEKRGFCGGHYYRWRVNGSATAGRTPNGKALAFINEVVGRVTDDCIFWPFGGGANSYPHVNGQLVHRLVCVAAHGEPPSPKHEAAHSCGKGHFGCINPKHLRWATHRENEDDKLAHGTSARGTLSPHNKLSEKQIIEIRDLARSLSGADLARRFGVSQSLISAIKKRKRWSWLEDARQ